MVAAETLQTEHIQPVCENPPSNLVVAHWSPCEALGFVLLHLLCELDPESFYKFPPCRDYLPQVCQKTVQLPSILLALFSSHPLCCYIYERSTHTRATYILKPTKLVAWCCRTWGCMWSIPLLALRFFQQRDDAISPSPQGNREIRNAIWPISVAVTTYLSRAAQYLVPEETSLWGDYF
ncbi:hypothetical protein Pelo_6233 [Pelomyxa schiedti]|nr:hypothetical protein Pelo_6233 [Pelomyxa schiedti]